MLMRGWRHYLYDEYGRTYLDAYNLTSDYSLCSAATGRFIVAALSVLACYSVFLDDAYAYYIITYEVRKL